MQVVSTTCSNSLTRQQPTPDGANAAYRLVGDDRGDCAVLAVPECREIELRHARVPRELGRTEVGGAKPVW